MLYNNKYQREETVSFINFVLNNTTVNVDNNGIVTITGLKFNDLRYFIKRYYNSEIFLTRFFINRKFWNTTVKMYQFYLPELLFLLSKAQEQKYISEDYAKSLANAIYKNTWMCSTQKEVESIVDLKYMESMMSPDVKLMNHQLEFIKDIYVQKKVQYQLNGYLLSLSQGLGKALENGTLVKVPGGWKRIEDLKVGDYVIAVDGSISKVTGVYPQGKQYMYRVTFGDGRNITTSGDHLWTITYPDKKYLYTDKNGKLIYDYYDAEKVMTTRDLFYRIQNPNRLARTHIPLCEHENTPDADLPLDPYLLGVLIGDGCTKTDDVSMTTDIDVINRVISRSPDTYRFFVKKEDNNANYSYYCRILRNKEGINSVLACLRSLKLAGKRSWEKFIPKIYMNSSRSQKIELLRGLMDTDGYATDPKKTPGRNKQYNCTCGSIEYCTTSQILAEQVQLLVRSLGGKCNLRMKHPTFTYNGERRNGRPAFILRIHMKNPSEIFTLERKKCRLATKNQYSKRWKLGVIKVERLGRKADCTCISIDHPSKLFVTKDYIVTHNSASSLSLGLALKKKHFVVICPLSTVNNVWVNEVHKFTKLDKIWTVNNPVSDIDKDTEVAILNYESIDKVADIIKRKFNASETIIIVDECHNFKDYKSKRFKDLYNFCSAFKCKDILLMSGTPIKALGIECIPIFKLLDPYFTKGVEQELVVLNKYRAIMNDLLRNRLGMIMFRKLKEEVLSLPPKFEDELKVTIPNGDRFTLDNVQKLVIKYTDERKAYYDKHFERYKKDYEYCLSIFEKILKTESDKARYRAYRDDVKEISRCPEPTKIINEIVIRANEYEKEVIIPNLPVNVRAMFRDSKSVVKYVRLKILGEVLGNLLGRLRMEMTSAMIDQPKIFDIIKDAQKKTILFSSYTDSIKVAEETCKKYKLNPLVITGENTKEATSIVDKFKKDDKYNPLIASIKVMSTGHTILVANTVIFLNVPFRSVDYDQASDRIYRVGADAPCYIYKLVLDTNGKPNLSTRMQSIIEWSKQSFNAIIGDDTAIEGMTVNNDHIRIFNEIQDIDDPKIQMYLDLIDKKLNRYL